MSLSNIKYKYLDKIQTIDGRIGRYQSIIDDYNKIIERAEKEEKQNISSVLKPKSDYEKKIENMSIIKTYYQEFVDVSDYLMQHINNNEYSLLITKNEGLLNRNQSLVEKNEELEQLVDAAESEVKKYKEVIRELKSRIKAKDEAYSDLRRRKNQQKTVIRELKSRIKAKDEAYSDLRRRKNQQKTKSKIKAKTVYIEGHQKIRVLSAENKKLKDTNEYLEGKVEVLQGKLQRTQDYCNNLLNRGEGK